jgi:lysophospholipase L1-like esterase
MDVSTFREMRRSSFRDATIGEQTGACRGPRRKELTLGKRCAFAVIPLVSLLLLAELAVRCFVSDFEIARRFRQIEQLIVFITFGNNDGWRWDGLADKEHAQLARPSVATSWLDHSRAWRWLLSRRMQSAHQQAAHEELRWAERASWNYIEPNATWTPRVSLPDFADNLHAMIDACRRQDCELVLIVWPDQRQLLGQPTWRLPYQEAMRQAAFEADVPCVDLVPLFEKTGRWAVERFLPRDVIHVDRAGNQLVAQAVAAHVRRLMAQ